MSLLEVVTISIAMWGAALSTYQTIENYRRSKPGIKVETTFGVTEVGKELSNLKLMISAANIGSKNVTLTGVGLLLPRKGRLELIHYEGFTALPYELTEGKSCTLWEDSEKIASQLRSHGYSGKIKLKGFYRTAIGKMVVSKPLKYDIDSPK